jgi:leader peptidase (prepilin peptidase)/N-methyltransferase
MGAVLGPGYHFAAYFLLAVVAGAVIGVGLMALRVRGRRDYIPFGPMLAASGIAVLLFGEEIVPWVIGRFTL